jgi:hypothetical protein
MPSRPAVAKRNVRGEQRLILIRFDIFGVRRRNGSPAAGSRNRATRMVQKRSGVAAFTRAKIRGVQIPAVAVHDGHERESGSSLFGSNNSNGSLAIAALPVKPRVKTIETVAERWASCGRSLPE